MGTDATGGGGTSGRKGVVVGVKGRAWWSEGSGVGAAVGAWVLVVLLVEAVWTAEIAGGLTG